METETNQSDSNPTYDTNIFNHILQTVVSNSPMCIQQIYCIPDYNVFYTPKFMRKFDYYADLIGLCRNNEDDYRLTAFVTAQKAYSRIVRFFFHYLKKTRKPVNAEDLYMQPIKEGDKYVIKLYHAGSNYLFTYTSLINIIKGKLVDTQQGILTSLRSKNPYNNLPLSRGCLLHFYLNYLNTYKYVDPMIVSYFQSEFNERVFYCENEVTIRLQFIKNLLNSNATNDLLLLREYVNNIFYDYCRSARIMVHPDFPVKELINVMRPYLYCYLITKYCSGNINIHAGWYLKNAIPDFAQYNNMFGRKYITTKRTPMCVFEKRVTYNIKHPPCSINTIIAGGFVFKRQYDILTLYDEDPDTEIDMSDLPNNSGLDGEGGDSDGSGSGSSGDADDEESGYS